MSRKLEPSKGNNSEFLEIARDVYRIRREDKKYSIRIKIWNIFLTIERFRFLFYFTIETQDMKTNEDNSEISDPVRDNWIQKGNKQCHNNIVISKGHRERHGRWNRRVEQWPNAGREIRLKVRQLSKENRTIDSWRYDKEIWWTWKCELG